MAYDLRSRLDTVGTRMKAINAVDVVVSRPNVAETSGTITATPAKTEIEVFDVNNNSGLTHKLQDWIFDVAEYAVGDPLTPVLPQRGDRITLESGRVFTVISLQERFDQGDAEPWEYITSSRLRIRVHTTEVVSD